MAFLIVAAESGIMAFVWVAYYNHELPKAYYFWGHIFISVVYMIILFLISIMYGGLKIGSYRMLELTFSQIFSTIITNILFYLIIVLLAYHFPSPFPVIGVTLLQCFVICGWVFMATMIYRRLFPPLNILLVYGGKQKDRFVEKVKTRRHQFSITVSMNAEEEELESIYKEIDAHEAVMFWDVPVNKRNSIFKY